MWPTLPGTSTAAPQELDLEAVREYQLHLAQERKLSPQSVNTFVSAVPFLYLVTLEMPWDKRDFPRARLEQNYPWCWPRRRPALPGPSHRRQAPVPCC